MKKRSFFERLSGSIPVDDYGGFEDDLPPVYGSRQQAYGSPAPAPMAAPVSQSASVAHHDSDSADGQLPVDVHQTSDEIIVRTFIAGVRPDDINLSISRDTVVIDGVREEREQVSDDDYVVQELFWGSFSRTIHLPQEIDVDAATATAKDGLLTLTLPRLDKTRQTKLKVKAG